jgi:type IV secretion system protein VirD4
VAPTRSGKGVGLVIPTLLSWSHSAVVLDIKGENWALSAGWRKTHAGNRVLKFDPTASDGSSVRFNPLEEVRLGPDEEVADAQNIATMIVDPDGKGLNDHWQRTAHALLVGAILHALYLARARGSVATLREVDLLTGPAHRGRAGGDAHRASGDNPPPVAAAAATC